MRWAAYICFKIVRNGIAFPKQISRIDKNSRKAHKKNTLSGCRPVVRISEKK